jgi:hypothetical protein
VQEYCLLVRLAPTKYPQPANTSPVSQQFYIPLLRSNAAVFDVMAPCEYQGGGFEVHSAAAAAVTRHCGGPACPAHCGRLDIVPVPVPITGLGGTVPLV